MCEDVCVRICVCVSVCGGVCEDVCEDVCGGVCEWVCEDTESKNMSLRRLWIFEYIRSILNQYNT